tara:strand:+ start:451 stop:660 length:210 start_codon:yes stop_codon:yes gene_type:complete
MKPTVVHNTISVEHFKSAFSDNTYCLYWQENDGNNSAFICSVYGYENARRVAEGIGHEQAEFIKFGVAE